MRQVIGFVVAVPPAARSWSRSPRVETLEEAGIDARGPCYLPFLIVCL